MKKHQISFVIPPGRLVRRRATELYGRDTPFRPKVEANKRAYRRQAKHPGQPPD